MSVVTITALKAKFETGDFPTQQDFSDFVDTVYPYEKYVALLTQTGTAAPVATVLENTLGGTVSVSYVTVGIYRLTLTGAFALTKTAVFIGAVPLLSAGMSSAYRLDNNSINVSTLDGSNILANGLLTAVAIEIRVYP